MKMNRYSRYTVKNVFFNKQSDEITKYCLLFQVGILVSLSHSQLTGLIDKDGLKTQTVNLQSFNSEANQEEAVVEKDSKHIFKEKYRVNTFILNS